MSPTKFRSQFRAARFPRMRGDEPVSVMNWGVSSTPSSPRVRG